MDINKAVDLLDNLIGMVDDNQGNDYDAAFHMAIDALKAKADGDTVSRKAAIKVASGYCHPANIAKELAKLPPAQSGVVRCKDCKHWLDIDDGRQKHRMCADIYGDWFCADAERRSDEGD